MAVLFIFLFLLSFAVFAQNTETEKIPAMSRGSIPEELLRPRREEAPRYPVDTVIGPLGGGSASAEAYTFARRVASALTEGRMNDPSLAAINTVMLESYLSALGVASPRSFRLGGGREEADGSVSFLVRFIGREQSITGELFVRYEQRQRPQAATTPAAMTAPTAVTTPEAETAPAETTAATDQPQEEVLAAPDAPAASAREVNPVWTFEELILEEARARESKNVEEKHRFDFSPYERFF